jgi:hypothetical protein
MRRRQLARTLLKRLELRQHLEIALPKPGVSGSIPFRDASRRPLVAPKLVQPSGPRPRIGLFATGLAAPSRPRFGRAD